MIIKPPKAIECSLEPKEVETIENCITLIENIKDKMKEYNYSYVHTNNDEEFGPYELSDVLVDLKDLIHIDSMY